MWGLNLGVHACQKNFKPFQHRRSIHASQTYMCHFHRTMTIHIGYQGLFDSYAFLCRIGLKLFLRLACAMGEGTTNFGIF